MVEGTEGSHHKEGSTKMRKHNTICAGIDTGKRKLDVALIHARQRLAAEAPGPWPFEARRCAPSTFRVTERRPQLFRRRHLRARRHHGDDGAGAVFDKFRIAFELIEAARLRDRLSVGAHRCEMPRKSLARVRYCLLKRIAGRDAAGHVGKADAVARAFVFVH